jgi:hypothetical protein
MLDKPLIFSEEGQKIATRDARFLKDFAILKLLPGPASSIILAEGIPGVSIERIIADGNRQNIQAEGGAVPKLPLISMGKKGGDNQSIRCCLVINSRSAGGWAAIHVHENCSGILIENNLVFNSGVDVRGNGRSAGELPLGWGDGISTAGRNSVVRNNLVIDASDEGIMVQGAAGSLVENNVISAVSREMLGGIALIDPSVHYTLDAEKKRYDYHGILVRNNLIESLGSRIHIGLPMGGPTWGQYHLGTTLVGAVVEYNTIAGNAAGYGYAANGIDSFTVRGNISTATYSGQGDGLPGNPPDPPGAFLCDPDHIGKSSLQKEFRPMENHLVHLMRNFYKPASAMGYRVAPYGKPEARATIRWAHLEMLGREPDKQEYQRWGTWLDETQGTADQLRQFLMGTEEFQKKHGAWSPLDLQEYRTRLWIDLLMNENEEIMEKTGEWPDAEKLYKQILGRILHKN